MGSALRWLSHQGSSLSLPRASRGPSQARIVSLRNCFRPPLNIHVDWRSPATLSRISSDVTVLRARALRFPSCLACTLAIGIDDLGDRSASTAGVPALLDPVVLASFPARLHGEVAANAVHVIPGPRKTCQARSIRYVPATPVAPADPCGVERPASRSP